MFVYEIEKGGNMTIVGFNFTKMLVERSSNARGQINISNNVGIKDAKEIDISLGKASQKAIRFMFEFVSSYDPNLGKIVLEGEIIYMGDESKIKEVIKEWESNKKVSPDLMTQLLNNILNKCNIQALIMARDINLPPPIPLPKVQAERTEAKNDEKKKKK